MSELFVFGEGLQSDGYNYYAIAQLGIALLVVLIWGSATLTRSKRAA